MAIVLVFLGCFLLYVKSKYAPLQGVATWAYFRANLTITRALAYALFSIALVLLAYQHGFFTGFTVFLMCLMLGLGLAVVVFPINSKYAYVLAGLSLFVILITSIF